MSNTILSPTTKYGVVSQHLDYNPNQRALAQSQVSSSNYSIYRETVAYKPDFWRSNRIRNGTWSLIFGSICLALSLILLSVFFRWWWSPSLNYTFRILGVTFGALGFCLCFVGAISNLIIQNNRQAKHFLGSPIRAYSYLMFVGIFFIVVASDCICVYYIYWHNRYVNTPLIISGIIIGFFGGLFVLIGLVKNIRVYRERHANGEVRSNKQQIDQIQQD